MRRRIEIFFMSILLGIGLCKMATGEWPEALWREKVLVAANSEGGEPSFISEDALKLSGMTAIEGPGIKITLEDAVMKANGDTSLERLVVHERDLMLIRNELFTAGAEAMSINGNRIVATTAIRCVGPAIQINSRNTVPPFVIEAVGEPEALKGSIMMRGGVVDLLAREKLRINIDIVEKLKIPKYKKQESTGEGKSVDQ